MRRAVKLWTLTLASILGTAASAQDLAGDWQGTLKTGARDLRLILHFAKDDNNGWRATLYSIDQTPDRGIGSVMTSVVVHGRDLRLTSDALHGSYEGKLSADANSISGIWTQAKALSLNLDRATKDTAWPHASPHSIQFITVDKDVKLEVLDWGGSGRPLVMLAGLGDTAHVFDKLAAKFTSRYHVYGITRRGFGASSAPVPDKSNYSADRLGDDVLAVTDALKLSRPVLVGHSIGGEELSSVASRHPEKVTGLIYLDAGYAYAYYDRARGDFAIDSFELKRKLDRLFNATPQEQKQLVSELLQTDLAQFQKDLREREKLLEASVRPGPAAQPTPQAAPTTSQAVFAGQQKYTDIRVPALAIYALPHDGFPQVADPEARAAAEAKDLETTGAQAKAFESGVPSAHVVRLPHANHFVFISNEEDVLREMNAFLSGLKTD